MTNQQQVKARRGCMFYGCIVSAVILLIAVAGVLVGLHKLKNVVNSFTDNAPAQFPEIKLSKVEITDLQKRVDDFKEAVRAGRATEPLVLTSDELNALIANDPDMQALKGRLYVTLENDQIKGQISWPMDELKIRMLKGRYFNASGTFTLSLRRGILKLNAQSLSVKGRTVPEEYMVQLRQQNFAENINKDPRDSAALDKLQSIEVKDGKLVIVPVSSQ